MQTKLTKWFLAFGLLILSAGASMAQNGTNPIAAFYNGPEGFPSWTREIKWYNTINMAQYANGSTEFEKFENARDDLYAQGGGVLYYPAGTYTFDLPHRGPNGRGLMLKKGVVIVGDRPTSDDKAVPSLDYAQMSTSGLNTMPTKFVFTDSTLVLPDNMGTGRVPFMWNFVGAMKGANEQNNADISHVGIAWVELEKATIYFGFGRDVGYAPTWGESKCWIGGTQTYSPPGEAPRDTLTGVVVNGWGARVPDGTHPMDAFVGCTSMGAPVAQLGDKRFVFGVKIMNGIMPNFAIIRKVWNPNSSSYNPEDYDGEYEVNQWRFGAKIAVNGRSIFVANNVVAKPTASFLTKVKVKPAGSNFHRGTVIPKNSTDAAAEFRTVLFDYGYGAGIDVNKGHASFMWNRCAYNDTNSLFYAPNVVVRDNWVYNHGHKGLELSGKYLVVRGNVNWRDFHRHNQTPYLNITGVPEGYANFSNLRYSTAENPDDNMSRAFDLSGGNIWIHQNNYSSTGSSTANDGEGILWQPHNGVEVISVAVTKNYKDGRAGDSGYIAPYDCIIDGLLQFENINERNGSTGATKVESHRMSNLSFVNNWNNIAKTTPASVAGQGTPSPNQLDVLLTCPTFNPNAPTVSVVHNLDENFVEVSWLDNTADEVGYRVDRQIAGTTAWETIAYRPRQETTTPWAWPVQTRGDYGPKPHGCGGITGYFNPPVWRDYMTGQDTSFIYRVVALNCAEDEVFSDQANVNVKLVGLATEVMVPKFSVYPNPAKGYVNIELENGREGVANVKVIDVNGRMIDSKVFNAAEGTHRLNTSRYATGVYFIEYSIENVSYRRKLVVE